MNSSYLRRYIVEPIYYTLNKSPRLRYWKHLESTQNLSTDELIQKQWNRLQSLIRFVYRYNKFYRVRFEQAGLHPSDIRTHRDITLLPVLTKEEIKKNLYDMISDGYQMENLLKFKTGGSTGKALELFITEECSELRNACARRHDRWSGWEVGEPIGAVWGNPVLPSSIKSKLREWLLYPMIYLDTMNLNDYSVTKFAKDWIRVKPTLLFGHAHSIFVLAEYVRKLEIKTIKPRGILSTSMMLMPHERHTIEEVFGIKVIDRYGCEEVSLIASECERHEGMHLNIEHLYIEFIKEDGSPAVSGEIGRIIVTDLMNMAMPFIRYQVDDMGIPIDKKCSCGRGLPLMDKVIGRTADFLIRQDGSRVAGVSLIENTLTKIPGIEQMQIIQDSLDRIILNVVKDMEYKDATDQSLRGYFQDLFGSNCNIIINLVQEIRPEKSGKYRFSICNII